MGSACTRLSSCSNPTDSITTVRVHLILTHDQCRNQDPRELVSLAQEYGRKVVRDRKMRRVAVITLVILPSVMQPAHSTVVDNVLHLDWPNPDQ